MGNFPDSLLRALNAGRVLPFVGAGVSRSVRTRTGRPAFPTWLELLEHCAHRLIDEHKPAIAADVRTLLAGATPDLLRAADVARRALFGRRWGDFLKEHFDPPRDALDNSSFDLAQAIWSIRSPLMITTNYDRVMEWACPHAADCQSWPTEAPAELARALDGTSQRSAVWHLHGKIHQLDQLILTSADYERLYPSDRVAADYASALATLRSLLAIKTFVFFGFSLSDERFLSTLLAVNETYRHTVGPHYAFVHRDDLQRLTPRAHELCLELLPFDAFGPPLVAMVCDLAAARGRALPPEDPPAATPSATQPVADLRPNLLLGRRYRIQQRLGHGGFATVWKAHDEHTGTGVAIKVLHPHLSHDDERVQRFERGAARMGALRHPNIVRVLAPVASDGPFRYFVMELLHADLATTVRNVRLPEEFVVGLVIQLGSALSHAHAHGLVHRDVKPANVLVDTAGSPKLTDFDLVLAHDSSGGTRTGALGTFLFAAPEVIADPSSANETADVFGLAMTAVFLFHGSPMGPEAYRNAGEFIERHLSCNNAVKSTLARACNWQRERRQRSVEEFCAHLQQAANQPRTPPRPTARDNVDPPRSAMPSLSESDPAWARRQPAAPSPSTNPPRTPHPPPKPPAKDVVDEPSRPAMPSLSESDPAWARRRPAAAPGPSTSRAGPLEVDLDEERPTARRSSSTSYLLVGAGALVGLIIWQAPIYMESETPESASSAPTPVEPSPPGSSPPPKDAPSTQTRPRPKPKPPELPKPSPHEPDRLQFPPTGTAKGTTRTVLRRDAPLRLIELTGGEFTLGSPFTETFHATDEPQRRVEVKPFLLGETEVTLRQWQAVMGAASGETGLGPDYPVQSVRWHRAIEFLNRLSEREGKTPCYAISGEDTTWNRRCDGYRLPSELEFEYALRAGTMTAYSFGDSADDLATYAWFADNAGGGPHKIRQRKPNHWGFYDMHGNVWEWVWDYYAGSYPATISSNYAGPPTGQVRVLRGGSFDDKASKLRSANRAGDYATRGGRFRGLRVASNR